MARHRPELDEDVDLDLDHRLFVLELHERLSKLTHYELLNVAREADKKEIKRAYFLFAGQFHPDRFRGRRLGSFKAMIDAIFARATLAHDTLSSPELRAEYDAGLPGPNAPSRPPAAMPRAPVDPRVAAKQSAAIDALKARFEEGKLRAKALGEQAARAMAAGDVVAARDLYEQALAITPSDPALRQAYEGVEREAATRLAESHVKKAELEERFGQWDAAVQSWRRVIEARPDDRAAHERLAHALARSGRAAPR
ncbi:MAG: DnaJ domain-containing protein [Deltaproteobacteria bacterium]|nr:DnaJ domain-containing protein [Deltaproteobacteria bacterium]